MGGPGLTLYFSFLGSERAAASWQLYPQREDSPISAGSPGQPSLDQSGIFVNSGHLG